MKPSPLIFAWFLSLSACLAQQATIVGRVPIPKLPAPPSSEKYAGTVSGKIGGTPATLAAVWLEGPFSLKPPKDAVPMAQRSYQFESSLLIVQTGTTVVFPNEDEDYHNVFSLSKTKRFDLGRYKKNEKPPPTVLFNKPGVVRLFCEIHEHMRGVIVVVDSPHFTRTDSTGTFQLAGLPAGKYTLKAWASEKHQWQRPVELTAGKALKVDFSSP